MSWIQQNANFYIHSDAPFSLQYIGTTWYLVDNRDQSKAIPFSDIFNNPSFPIDLSTVDVLVKSLSSSTTVSAGTVLSGTHIRGEAANTPSTPAHSFKTEISSGFYRESSGVLAMAVLGNKQFSIDSIGNFLTPNQPRFFAKKTSTSGITANAIIPTWTEDVDTGNNFNSSTGVYTIPVSGFYLFFAYSSINDSTTATLRIRKNGVLQSSMNGQSITGFNNFNCPVLYLGNCLTSDTIDFYTNVLGLTASATIPIYFGGLLLG